MYILESGSILVPMKKSQLNFNSFIPSNTHFTGSPWRNGHGTRLGSDDCGFKPRQEPPGNRLPWITTKFQPIYFQPD